MIEKLNKHILEVLCQASFNKIIDYILDICEMIVKDYEEKLSKLPNNENAIRSIMLEEYLKPQRKSYKMQGYKFEPETQENYIGNGVYSGRIDIRVSMKSNFEKDEAYYVIECKRIDGSTDLNKKYVEDGIARFVVEKYSSYFGRNIMLGFVVKKIDILDNVQKIVNIQNANEDSCMHGNFMLVKKEGITENYSCTYQIQSGELELRHIFSDFSSVM